eukprot:m.135224 g.135224  ORF g.135224 m.135224 type:complete len:400 (-) comp13899_c0_seq1:41-1240(-)
MSARPPPVPPRPKVTLEASASSAARGDPGPPGQKRPAISVAAVFGDSDSDEDDNVEAELAAAAAARRNAARNGTSKRRRWDATNGVATTAPPVAPTVGDTHNVALATAKAHAAAYAQQLPAVDEVPQPSGAPLPSPPSAAAAQSAGVGVRVDRSTLDAAIARAKAAAEALTRRTTAAAPAHHPPHPHATASPYGGVAGAAGAAVGYPPSMTASVATGEAAITAEEIERKLNEKPKYDYDSDEDTTGGTWEHKKRAAEMKRTEEETRRLNEAAEQRKGTHFQNYIPKDVLEQFLEKADAVTTGRAADLSDYRKNKIGAENVGYQMLQKAGWTSGQGLGTAGQGITAPVNRGATSANNLGVGVTAPTEVAKEDDAVTQYRKRMMLAYKYRPNPLNNPRRPY